VDAKNTQSLRETINAISGIDQLRYQPRVENVEVGQNFVQAFRQINLIPTLLFVDPWGYKGLSLALIGSVLRNWGCDCVFFFNYNRVNPALNNEAVREHMKQLFGEKRAETIRRKLSGLSPDEREHQILEEFSQALKEFRAEFILPFTFKNEQGTRTKHHLIFASKKFKGYEIMKEIMARESSERDQGVASFAYTPASKKHPTLFELSRPLDDLEKMLSEEFAGQTLTMRKIYERHSVGKPYTEANYKKALTEMEVSNQITADPPAAKRRKKQDRVTFGDNVVVTFPGGAKK
jgi:hypothetical protein